jgi:hypothetical protein
LILFILIGYMPACFAATLYVVVSNNLRGNSYSQAEVKRILLGEVTSINNERVRLIYPSYTSSEIVTLSIFVGKGSNVRDLKSYWSKMIFTGRGNPPETANDQADLKRLLQENNSIGVTTEAAGMNVIYTITD